MMQIRSGTFWFSSYLQENELIFLIGKREHLVVLVEKSISGWATEMPRHNIYWIKEIRKCIYK